MQEQSDSRPALWIGQNNYLPLRGPVLTAPSRRGRLGSSFRLSISAAPGPKDCALSRSEILQAAKVHWVSQLGTTIWMELNRISEEEHLVENGRES